MITKKLWYEFNTIELVKESSIWYWKYTPSEMACLFVLYVILTPFCIVLDLVLIPIEIMYYYVKRYYVNKLEIERKEDDKNE